MSYPFVGFYYCHYGDADIDNTEESSSVYLYVNGKHIQLIFLYDFFAFAHLVLIVMKQFFSDPDHLTTLELNNAIEQVVVTQYQEAVIPCKPTAPDVQVTLSTMADGMNVSVNVIYFCIYSMYFTLTSSTSSVRLSFKWLASDSCKYYLKICIYVCQKL